MPATRKRKRSYRRRPYARKRRSMSSIVRGMAKANTQVGPYGPDSAGNFNATYGPSNSQLRKYPMSVRTGDQNFARVRDRYYGPGGYWQDVGKNVGHWGTRIGGATLGALGGFGAGGIVGAAEGGVAGWETGAGISKALGWGTYEIPRGANDLVVGGHWAEQGNGSAPVYHSLQGADEGGDVVISNRELVQLVKASADGSFKIDPFSTNPADEVFHHLRQQASQYENFEFLGLMFQYVPMTGEGGSNNLGVVGMATSYDPEHEREFSNLEDLLRFKGATTCKPSVGMLHGIECDPAKRSVKVMYVRDNIKRDKPFTDPATFYIASQGCEANATLGQLWVTYSVRLRNIKPYIPKESSLLHAPKIMKQGIDWTSTTSSAVTSLVNHDDDIVKVTNGNSTTVKVQFEKDIRKDQVFFFILYHHNTASDLFATTASVTSLVNCQLVPMSSYSGTSTTNQLSATETSTDHRGISLFKVQVNENDSHNQATFEIDVTAAAALWGMQVLHADDEVHHTVDNPKILYY